MLDPRLVLAALLAAVAAAYLARLVVRPTRALAPRVRPYAQLSRSRLGRSADATLLPGLGGSVSPATVGRVFAPLLSAAAKRFSNLVDAGGEDHLRLRLRQAGFADTSPEQYRMRQLSWATAATVGAGFFGGLVGGSAFVLGFGGLGLIYGATYWRGKVNRAITTRAARMRVELYTVAHLLAMLIRTGHGPMHAVRAVLERGRGPVVEELSEAMSWIAGGMSEADAFERLAEDTPEPAAARLYRLVASGIQAGGDLGTALLTVSDDLRAARREDLEREATKRRGAMLVPTIVVMAPVVLVFIAAPLPTLILGGR